jgi:hypothetical protein
VFQFIVRSIVIRCGRNNQLDPRQQRKRPPVMASTAALARKRVRMNGPTVPGLDRIFVLFIVVAFGGLSSSSATGEDGRAKSVVAFIAEQREEAPVLDLLELHILDHEGLVEVDRECIDDILREHALATLLGAEHAENRVRVGRLLGCDLLLIARLVQEPQPHVRLVFSDTQMGVRFLNVTLGLQDHGPKMLEDLDRSLDLSLKKLRSPRRVIVAVPPFISHDLSREHEHLQAALARIVEHALLPRR